MLTCPKCGNDRQSLFDTWNHLRHQMDVSCNVCAHAWVHVHPGVAKASILPKEVSKPGGNTKTS